MSHICNQDCIRQYNYGYNCRSGMNNWHEPNPPWQESGFWGGGIEPNEDELERVKCHSAQYRSGWQAANNKLLEQRDK